jgi:hypothetical protein
MAKITAFVILISLQALQLTFGEIVTLQGLIPPEGCHISASGF